MLLTANPFDRKLSPTLCLYTETCKGKFRRRTYTYLAQDTKVGYCKRKHWKFTSDKNFGQKQFFKFFLKSAVHRRTRRIRLRWLFSLLFGTVFVATSFSGNVSCHFLFSGFPHRDRVFPNLRPLVSRVGLDPGLAPELLIVFLCLAPSSSWYVWNFLIPSLSPFWHAEDSDGKLAKLSSCCYRGIPLGKTSQMVRKKLTKVWIGLRENTCLSLSLDVINALRNL